MPTSLNSMAPIVSAEAFDVAVRLVTPYKLSDGVMASTYAVMLKLTDADGVVGWGEANPKSSFAGETTEIVMGVLKDTLLPALMALKNPLPGRVDADFDTLMEGQLCAKGAVTMALLDILGKRLQVPVATLLGGAVHASLPILWPLSNGTPDEDLRVIDEKVEQGFSSFMLKMGTSPIAEEIDRVWALEKRYGDRIGFIADSNQGWTREQSVEFVNGVKGCRLAFVEQPVVKDDFEGMAMIAASTTLPISADESVISLSHAGELARLRAASVFSVKSSKNGGPLRAQRIASVAEAFGIRIYMNSMVECGITQAASLHHGMTIRNLIDFGHAYMSTLRLAEDPTDFSSFVKSGRIELPARPGLGLQVDEQHVRRLASSSFKQGVQS